MHFHRLTTEILAILSIQVTHVQSSPIARDAPGDFTRWILDTITAIVIDVPTDVPDTSFGGPYTIPNQDHPVLREAGVALKRANFQYGPPVAGGPSYPTGPLALAKIAKDVAELQSEIAPAAAATLLDITAAVAQISNYNGLQNLEDYTSLYQNNWKNTLPDGPDDGVLTNYTQDLYFSMQRLANSPFKVRRLDPSSELLPFQVEDVKKITGSSLDALFKSRSLFYTDYRDQKDLPKSSQFAAACDGYYYISRSGEFLPLAIRTNVGSSLIYTPLDSQMDWLLAKIMLNVNDFWFAQVNHLAQVHEVAQITSAAAVRGFSEEHPVLAIINRLTLEGLSIQLVSAGLLFPPGGVVDQILPFSGQAAQEYSTDRYHGTSGSFTGNYFKTDLEARGLINSQGPALKHFPFYEDAKVINDAIHAFMTSFIGSYYSTDADVANDKELQAWVQEAQGPAQIRDFPSISTRSDLINAMTNIAHLVSASHHTSNTNDVFEISSTLPLNPSALFNKDVPTTKGVKNAADYLPKLDKVFDVFQFGGVLTRHNLANSNRSLLHMFDDADMLRRMNSQTTAAAAKFKSDLQTFSNHVSSRGFDASGLSQGMPFLWKTLDPNVAPYSVST